ncbi:MAG: phosphate signaling complex protein PhoU [Ignavibacteria bacterium]|nr:phosphate signaling complex protein PhoU [Ignavibacteria bacterium]
MDRHFIREIEELKKTLLQMVSAVDEQVEMAYNALLTGDLTNSDAIKKMDIVVDQYDNQIKEQAKKILALYQPVASDLRFVFTAIMINNQLERCGDLSVNIMQRIKKTQEARDIILESDLLEMIKLARFMVKDAIDAFIHEDTQLAKTVMDRDSYVDALNKAAFKFLVGKMEQNPLVVKACAHLLILAKHIERLADHATNIAEDVIFLISDEIVTHRFNEEASPAEDAGELPS